MVMVVVGRGVCVCLSMYFWVYVYLLLYELLLYQRMRNTRVSFLYQETCINLALKIRVKL